MQPPVIQSIDVNGKTYTLQPIALSGENLDRINGAVHRSRTKKAMETLIMVESMACTTEAERKARLVTHTAILQPVTRFEPLDRGDLVRAIACDPLVMAELVYVSSPECDTLESGQFVVDSHSDALTLGGILLQVTGLVEVGKPQASKGTVGGETPPSGGAAQG